ncbi:MAG: MAPEG family protein [Sulfitobacter sp.]
MLVTTTALYAALLTLLFITLSWRVIMYRRANSISLGDNDDKALRKRMRAQANFIEYAPLGLILMLITELQSAPEIALHAMGLTLLVGRVLHAVGFSSTPQKMVLRQIGMVLTLGMLVLSALALLSHLVF